MLSCQYETHPRNRNTLFVVQVLSDGGGRVAEVFSSSPPISAAVVADCIAETISGGPA
jgi:hypothetical protein